MSLKRLRISREEEEDQYYYLDPLNSLPDELLLLIFSKITDPKTLLICSLICNRIASILSHSQSISIQFLTRLMPFTTIPILNSFDDLCDKLTNLLCRFHGVQSLRVEVPCFCRCPEDIVFKWKAKADLQCGILSFLSTKFVCKMDYKKIEVKKEEEEGEEQLVHAFNSFGPFVFANKMYLTLLTLISRHPNLDRIEFVDSMKHGKLSLRREELIKLRMAENSDLFGSPADQRIWHVPKVRLSLSGFEMNEVTLVVTRGDRVDSRKGKELEGNVEAVLDAGFEDDEHGIFDEAMTQILTRHPSKTFSF